MKKILLLVLIFLTFTPAFAQESAVSKGLALTPPMGWNSWNKFGCNVSDELVRGMADAMVKSGMKDADYQYIVIDDCWQVSRDAHGNIVADPQRFPQGIKALADYVHSVGLKFGIYSDAGAKTCEKRPGGLGHADLPEAQQDHLFLLQLCQRRAQAAIASTIPIMGAPCKGSRWRPSSHDFSAPALGWGAGAARRLAIAVHAVLSRRAFVVVAALERGVHVFADAARADETLGAVRGVAALRRDAALADAGVGAACGSEQEQERESHGSPVLPDARGAVSVTWRRRFHRGSSRATLLRGEGARTNTPTIPARNPPTCAHQATPPVPSGTFSEATPESNCMPNQKSR